MPPSTASLIFSGMQSSGDTAVRQFAFWYFRKVAIFSVGSITSPDLKLFIMGLVTDYCELSMLCSGYPLFVSPTINHPVTHGVADSGRHYRHTHQDSSRTWTTKETVKQFNILLQPYMHAVHTVFVYPKYACMYLNGTYFFAWSKGELSPVNALAAVFKSVIRSGLSLITIATENNSIIIDDAQTGISIIIIWGTSIFRVADTLNNPDQPQIK